MKLIEEENVGGTFLEFFFFLDMSPQAKEQKQK